MKAPISEYWIFKLIAVLTLHIAINNFAHAALKTELYTSQYIAAEDLKTSIGDAYPDAIISHNANQLIIRADSPALSEILEILPMLDKPGDRYRLTFSDHPNNITNSNNHSNSNRYISEKTKINNHQFSVLANDALLFIFSNHQERRVNLSRFYYEEDVATQTNTLKITVSPIGKQRVKLEYQIYQLINGKRKLINNSIETNVEEWVSLVGQYPPEQKTTKTYTSHKNKDFSLFIKINRL
jgi:type II secretory pathway component GspD/PulD (secretin)